MESEADGDLHKTVSNPRTDMFNDKTGDLDRRVSGERVEMQTQLAEVQLSAEHAAVEAENTELQKTLDAIKVVILLLKNSHVI